jgi:hypothetical protein
MALKRYTVILLVIIFYSALQDSLVCAQRKRRSREGTEETHMTNQQELEEVEKLEKEAEDWEA